MSYQQDRLQEIADAIREKEGSSDPIPAVDFAERVRGLPIGGEGVKTLTVERHGYEEDWKLTVGDQQYTLSEREHTLPYEAGQKIYLSNTLRNISVTIEGEKVLLNLSGNATDAK